MNGVKSTMVLLLAWMVFSSSIGLRVDLHFCNGELKSFNLFGEARSCHDIAVKKKKQGCPHHLAMAKSQLDSEKKANDCCSNNLLELDGKIIKQLPLEVFQFSLSDDLSFAPFIVQTDDLVEWTSIRLERSYLYKPPKILRNFVKLFQSFLL